MGTLQISGSDDLPVERVSPMRAVTRWLLCLTRTGEEEAHHRWPDGVGESNQSHKCSGRERERAQRCA